MKEGAEVLKEFGLFLSLLGIGALTIWLQQLIPSTGAALFILGAVLIFISRLYGGEDEKEGNSNKV